MGRTRKHHTGLPQRVYLSHGQYFFVEKSGRWIPLGADLPAALEKHRELLAGAPGAGTVKALIADYRSKVLPGKAAATQQGQGRQLDVLDKVFGHMRVDDLDKGHVAEYLDTHPSPVSANREIALLSHVYTKAIRWKKAGHNPCMDVERNPEKPRDLYVSDELFLKVYQPAPPLIQVMMGLGLITGQREEDLLRIRKPADLGKDGINFRQGKTGKKLMVRWSDALAFVIEQASQLAKPGSSLVSTFVVSQPNGQPYTPDGFRNAWKRHMRALIKAGAFDAAERFQFRDLRAKAGSDAPDGKLLGHADPRLLRRVYMRKPEAVNPTR